MIGLVRSYSRCRGMGLCFRAWLRLRLLAASSNHELVGRIEGPFCVPSFRAAPRRDVIAAQRHHGPIEGCVLPPQVARPDALLLRLRKVVAVTMEARSTLPPVSH